MTGRRAPIAIAAVAIALVLIARMVLHTAPLDALAPGAPTAGDPAGIVRTGAIDLPRGGPFVLGFQASGPARLEIAGKVIAGSGLVTQRIVLQAGAASIRYAGPADGRLIWHPPGRRGAPEYVLASSLSDQPPASAMFSWSGAAPLDAACVALIAAIALITACWLLRRRIARVDRALRWAVLAVFATSLALSMIDLGDAGQTFDEDEYWSSGRNYMQNVLGGDFANDAWTWNYEHPPVTKYLAGAGALWADGYGPARAIFAVCMALGCALLVPIGARLYRPGIGLAAGGFAALSPHLLAHGPIVGHEAPTVLWWSLALWLCLRAYDPVGGEAGDAERGAGQVDARALAWRMAGIGVVLGLALMTRFVNGLLAPAIGATLLACAPPALRRRTFGYGLAIIPAVAVLTSIALWPRLWSSPFAHLAESWAKLRGTHGQEWFLGEFTVAPSRAYFAIYLAAVTPLVVLLAALAWFGRAGRAWWRRRDPALLGERRAAIVVGVWLIAPLGVALSPVRQDGVRYVLPSLCALAVMAAAGLELLPAFVRKPDSTRARRAVWSAAASVVTLSLLVTCLWVRPYYLDYYGAQVGGPSGVAAHRRFEIAWWGEGLADAITYVNDHAAPGARVHRDCIEPSHLTWFNGDLWDPMVKDPAQADWIVWYAPASRPCPIPPGARLVYRTEIDGAPLAEVYRVEQPARPASRRTAPP
jgi:4-amino-4-deoxy-L-arabinose transferase-like glycosyltransferase